ncbi:MAG: TonB-dependent receptor [Flavipsychrobacter sp.]|nr:TonB-dependent receptor [Flavipsychrobacter sp.]
MAFKRVILSITFICSFICSYAQRATITGVVRDEHGKGMEQAVITDEVTGIGTYSNAKGYYTLEVDADKNLGIVYAFTGYQMVRKRISLAAGETRTIDIVLKEDANELKTFTKTSDRKRTEAGLVYLDLTKVDFMPSTIGGVEGLIKLAVGSHNELSSQYSVRGGSYDENLVYVNDFEVYRPFLVRAAQQEGLSFINSDLVSNVNFSVGGFGAKYGDKMSSVLDVSYKRPTHFAGSVSASLLGANMHLEGASKNQKLTYLIGARQKTNQYLLQAQPTKGVYSPSFTDVQAMLNYRINKNWEMEVIGNYARNRFVFFPKSMVSSFGVLNQAYQLDVFYYGSEFDQFDSRFGGISTTYHKDSSKLKLKFLASGFQTNEFETYDIQGYYSFGELQTDQSKADYGQIKSYLGAGGIQNFARNYLNVNVGDVGFRGSYDLKKNYIQFGANGMVTSITDDLHQWERRDSAAFTQPYSPDALVMANFFNSSASLNYFRISGFVQDNIRFDSANRFSATVGIRFNYSELNKELITSPRIQLSYKPDWVKDVVFSFSSGLYAQPPFYREMRDLQGGVNTNLKSQKSAHLVGGVDYNFRMLNRPFKIKAETYYKKLWDLDPYYYDNVRVRYTGKNDAIGYVYGGEVRLYGDLVKDATSFISIGVMKAEQKITDSAGVPGYNNYFPLPSDQRFTLGMYFEDYLPRNKNFKVHINAIYSTGLPVGPPTGHLYQGVLRLPDFKRVDMGFSALLLDAGRRDRPAHSFFNNVKSIWASLEVFNLLSIQNTLSYTWIQDWTTQKVYAVPNRLTSRLLNVKLLLNF